MQLDNHHTAILALHFERDTIEPDGAFGAFFNPMIVRDSVLENTARVLDVARAHEITVVYVRVQFPAGYAGLDPDTGLNRAAIDTGSLIAGTRGTEIVDELAPAPGDILVDHRGGTSAFRSHELVELLSTHAIDTLLVCGVSTNVIVEGTVHDAINRDLRVFVLSDCCASGDDATQQASLATLGMISHGLITSHDVVGALTAGLV